MTIDLDLKPDVEAVVRERADREGKPLPIYLAEWIEDTLSRGLAKCSDSRSLLELEGAGAELWRRELAGKDAQEYVSEARSKEWEHRV